MFYEVNGNERANIRVNIEIYYYISSVQLTNTHKRTLPVQCTIFIIHCFHMFSRSYKRHRCTQHTLQAVICKW